MPAISLSILLPFVLLGEIIDRSEFYYESEVTTPQGELSFIQQSVLKEVGNGNEQ